MTACNCVVLCFFFFDNVGLDGRCKGWFTLRHKHKHRHKHLMATLYLHFAHVYLHSVIQDGGPRRRGSVATRIILLFFASLRENLFVFLFPLFCCYLSFLALRNTPVDYATTPSTYSFIYCACIFFGSSFP